MIYVDKDILFEIKDKHIGIVTLNRPDAANSLSKNLLAELDQTIDKIKGTDELRCIIFTGASDRAFCAGADLKERKDMTEDEVVQTVKHIGRVIKKIEDIPIPTIAAINGVAFGGGLELALACDIRLAKTNVTMGLTETSLAIIPGAGGTQRLPRLIGLGKAKELIFTSKRIGENEAYEIGLIEKIIYSSTFLDEVIRYANNITKNAPIALKQAKQAIHRGMQVDITKALQIEHECYLKTIPTEDRLEGLLAFQDKRQPQYKGK